MTKEELIRKRAEIDAALADIEKAEREEGENRTKDMFASIGQYIPLNEAIVNEDLFFVTGDENISIYGYGTALDILGEPQLKKGTALVLIENRYAERMWVPKREDDNYFKSGYDDFSICELEAEDKITIIK